MLSAAAAVSPKHPVVITKFIDNAQEIDVDAVAHKGKLLIHAVSEHVENAGVHSGDATLVLPPFTLDKGDMARLKEIAAKVAAAFEISGPFNMQVIRKPAEGDDSAELKVIECNLRASRSFPFVSKVLGVNFIDIATAAITGHNVPDPVDPMAIQRDYYAIKVSQFSWTRLPGADPFLGVGECHLSVLTGGTQLLSQKWRARVKSPALAKISTKPIGPLSRAQPDSSFLPETQESSLVETSPSPRCALLQRPSWISASSSTVHPPRWSGS